MFDLVKIMLTYIVQLSCVNSLPSILSETHKCMSTHKNMSAPVTFCNKDHLRPLVTLWLKSDALATFISSEVDALYCVFVL